jgi:hypothetical protein
VAGESQFPVNVPVDREPALGVLRNYLPESVRPQAISITTKGARAVAPGPDHDRRRDEGSAPGYGAWSARKSASCSWQAGEPREKGNRRGRAQAYCVKALRDLEQRLAREEERSHREFAAKPGKDASGLCASTTTGE